MAADLFPPPLPPLPPAFVAPAPPDTEVEVEAGAERKNSKLHEEIRESTLPYVLVIAIVGHENPSTVVVVVVVSVSVVVDRLEMVTISVQVIKGEHDDGAVCRPSSISSRATATGAAMLVVVMAALVLPGGGMYDSTQAASSSSVAPCELVAVTGGHENWPLASAGSLSCVAVMVTTETQTPEVVVVCVTVASGQSVQEPSEPQYSQAKQQNAPQQVVLTGQVPPPSWAEQQIWLAGT